MEKAYRNSISIAVIAGGDSFSWPLRYLTLIRYSPASIRSLHDRSRHFAPRYLDPGASWSKNMASVYLIRSSPCSNSSICFSSLLDASLIALYSSWWAILPVGHGSSSSRMCPVFSWYLAGVHVWMLVLSNCVMSSDEKSRCLFPADIGGFGKIKWDLPEEKGEVQWMKARTINSPPLLPD